MFVISQIHMLAINALASTVSSRIICSRRQASTNVVCLPHQQLACACITLPGALSTNLIRPMQSTASFPCLDPATSSVGADQKTCLMMCLCCGTESIRTEVSVQACAVHCVSPCLVLTRKRILRCVCVAGLIHFAQNLQCEPAQFIASFPTSDPGTSTVAEAFFTKLPQATIRATLGLDDAVIEAIVAKVSSMSQANPSLDLTCLANCGISTPGSYYRNNPSGSYSDGY